MQLAITGTRDADLVAAAELAECEGTNIGLFLRQSRLRLWEESASPWGASVEELKLIVDKYAAEYYASLTKLRGELQISDEHGSYEFAVETYDELLGALRRVFPRLEGFEIVEVYEEELPRVEGHVAPAVWNGVWLRSQSERRIAEALERANVLFIANPTTRVGVTADHRQSIEPDFLIWAHKTLGILEVDGEAWHPAARAAHEHERDRRFHEHGISVVQRYDAGECYDMPDEVVAGFLRLLDLNGYP